MAEGWSNTIGRTARSVRISGRWASARARAERDEQMDLDEDQARAAREPYWSNAISAEVNKWEQLKM